MYRSIATGYLLNSNVFLMNSKTVVMQLPSHVAMAASSRAVFSSICLYHSKQQGCTIMQDYHLQTVWDIPNIVCHVLLFNPCTCTVVIALLHHNASHDSHMISHDTVTDNVLTRPSRIRLMVSGMEGVFHLLAFSFWEKGREKGHDVIAY